MLALGVSLLSVGVGCGYWVFGVGVGCGSLFWVLVFEIGGGCEHRYWHWVCHCWVWGLVLGVSVGFWR